MTFATFLSYWSGLAFVAPELPWPTLVGTVIGMHVCDAIMCRLLAHNGGELEGHSGRPGVTAEVSADAPPPALPPRGRGAPPRPPPPAVPVGPPAPPRDAAHAPAEARGAAVVDGEDPPPDDSRASDRACLAVQEQPGRLAPLAHHLDVPPGARATPPRAQPLHHRLLGGEAGGVALEARPPAR